MARRNRETLKNFFRHGSLPSEESFHDLIDSTLNMSDEGFDKSPENGFQVLAQGSRPSLLTFYREEDPADPIWRLALDEVDRRRLLIWDDGPEGREGEIPADGADDRGPRRPTLTLGPGARVGVNTAEPQRELDVDGFVRSRGREGVVPERPARDEGGEAAAQGAPPVLADGAWHDITGPLDGCHALEVVAGVGLKGSGHYALLHAIAMNTYNPTGFFFNFLRRKKPIRVTQAYHRNRSDRLALRWTGDEKSYRLQIRTRRDYRDLPNAGGASVRIRYHVTELWSDLDMSGSWSPREGGSS